MNSRSDNGSVSGLRLKVMVVTLGAAYFFSNFHRLALGVLGETVAVDFGLTASQLGMLGAALFYAYATMQLPSGIIADFVPPRTIITTACLLTGISTICFSMTDSFSGLLVSRAATGLSVALVYVPALSTLRQRFGDESLGTMTGILVAMGQMGAVCASAPLKFMSDLAGWRFTFLAIGIVSIVLSAAVYFAVTAGEPSSAGEALRKKVRLDGLRNPGFIAIVVWFFIFGGTRYAFQGLWGTAFYTKVLLLTSTQSGMLLLWMSLGCIGGALVLGTLSDVLGSIRSVLLCGLSLTAIWLGLMFVDTNTPLWVVYFLSTALGVFGTGGFTVGFTCIRTFADRSNTGILTGVLNCSAFMGSAVFTQLTGEFMSATAQNRLPSESFFTLFVAFALMCLASALAVLRFAKVKTILPLDEKLQRD